MKRVLCLYRVSTKGQVDKKDDIPMQRRECMAFIERMEDWCFYDELMEKGVHAEHSGHLHLMAV